MSRESTNTYWSRGWHPIFIKQNNLSLAENDTEANEADKFIDPFKTHA